MTDEEWDEYWESLTEEEREDERRMMCEYAAYHPDQKGDE
jgi:hypothetical protein